GSRVGFQIRMFHVSPSMSVFNFYQFYITKLLVFPREGDAPFRPAGVGVNRVALGQARQLHDLL
ncbi:MAG: hypothetical protein QF920_10420, partial [Verrucomicrobiota bacterium]|nr:hypothetical protein [Verrucomicrobiota bacterium]